MSDLAPQPIQLLTFLGASAYTPGRYRLDNQTSGDERYAQVALLELLGQQGCRVDLVTVCLTELARKRNWEHAALAPGEALLEPLPPHQCGLQQQLAALDLTVEPIYSFPEGRTESELWDMFDLLQQRIRPDYELVVDVTHGFRCFPVVLCIALAFLRQVKGLHVRALWYGAWEARDPDRGAPFFDLSALLELLDWSGALGRLLETGDARGLAHLLAASAQAPTEIDAYGAAVYALADALSCAAAPAIAPRARDLADAFQPLPGLVLPPSLQPVAQVLAPIQQRYAGLAPAGEGLAAESRAQLAAARMLFEHHQLQPGYTLLSEVLLSLVAELLAAPDRATVGGRVGELKRHGVPDAYVAALADVRDAVDQVRHAFNHAWTKREFETSAGLAQRGLELANRIERELLPLPALGGRSPGRRLLVLMSHRLLPQQELEARERLGVTEFVQPTDQDRERLANVPPDEPLTKPDGTTANWLSNLRKRLERLVEPGDCALLQGEPGVTFYLVSSLRRKGIACYHATTTREVVEEPQPDGTVRRTSRFTHVRFREYT